MVPVPLTMIVYGMLPKRPDLKFSLQRVMLKIKRNVLILDVPNVQIYAFTVSGWPTPRTAEEVLNAARKSNAESIQRITQILESGDYESDREYWESRLAQEKARSYAVMTYGEWLDFERKKLLTPEMVEITKQDYPDHPEHRRPRRHRDD